MKPIFGDISGNTRESRLFSIGMGVGVIVGAAAPFDWLRVALILVATIVIIVRSLAQMNWPDQPSPSAERNDNGEGGPR